MKRSLSRIMHAIEAGHKVRVRSDLRGREVVEIRRGWWPIGRTFVLPHHVLLKVKVILALRGAGSSRAAPGERRAPASDRNGEAGKPA